MKNSLWHRYEFVAYLAILAGVVGHSTSEFVSVLTHIEGPELSVWRFLLGGIGLIILSLLFPNSRNLIEPFQKEGLRLVWLSALGITIGYLFFHMALDYATVPQVATMITTVPIFVGFISSRKAKKPFPRTKLITGYCAMIGVALLITEGTLAALFESSQNLIGILMTLVCAAALAFFTVFIRPMIDEFGALRITTITMNIGGVGLWLVVGLYWSIWVNPLTLLDRPPQEWGYLLTLAIGNTTITQFLWLGGLAAVSDITRGSYLFFFKPVIAAVLAVVFLNQSVTPFEIAAIAVICISVLFEASQAFKQTKAT
ncbi:MAG: DMT family transporter [Sedimenticola sp.]